jgi:hypothetical protein
VLCKWIKMAKRVRADCIKPLSKCQPVFASIEVHWTLLSCTVLLYCTAGMETMTTNLATTRRNNTSSVTWLAIPTMASTSGLPSTGLQTPSTRRYSGSIHTSSTGMFVQFSCCLLDGVCAVFLLSMMVFDRLCRIHRKLFVPVQS